MRGDTRLEIGGVARAHGIRGEIVIVTHDPDSATLGSVSSIFIGGIERKVVAARDTQRGWLVALEGVTTRTEAESFRGKPVEVDRDALDLDEDDVILDDLVGCDVRLPDGTPWGTVFAIDAGAHQDLLVIHDGDLERLLPLVDEFVTGIDVDNGIVTVDPPADLPASKLTAKDKAIAEKHRRAGSAPGRAPGRPVAQVGDEARGDGDRGDADADADEADGATANEALDDAAGDDAEVDDADADDVAADGANAHRTEAGDTQAQGADADAAGANHGDRDGSHVPGDDGSAAIDGRASDRDREDDRR